MAWGQEPGQLKKYIFIALIFTLLIFLGLCLYADFGNIGEAFSSFVWAYIPLLLLFTLLNNLFRFIRWDYYLRQLKVKLNLRDNILIYLSGLSMIVTPLKLGELLKSYLLKQTNGAEMSKTMPIVFVERGTDIIGLIILAALGFSAFQYGAKALIITIAVILLLIVLIRVRRLCLKILSLTEKVPLISKLTSSLYTFYESSYQLLSIKNLLVAVPLSVAGWFFECLALAFVLQGFGILDVPLTVPTFIYSFSSLVGGISMIPGGLGVAEAGITGLLILQGIPKAVAAASTIIIRLCTLWFSLLLGIIALSLFWRRGFKYPGEALPPA